MGKKAKIRAKTRAKKATLRTKKPRPLNPADARLLRVIKFLVKFNVYAIPLYIILLADWRFAEFQQFTANAIFQMLGYLGMDPSMNGFMISIPINNGSWGAFINWDCTGWKSLLAFFALVMATDMPMKRKAYGLVLLPVIYAINIGRVIFMFFYVRTFDLANYELVHAVVWSWGLILVILALWILWMRHDFTKFRAENIFWDGPSESEED